MMSLFEINEDFLFKNEEVNIILSFGRKGSILKTKESNWEN